MTDFEALLLKPMLRIDKAALLLDVTPRGRLQALGKGKVWV